MNVVKVVCALAVFASIGASFAASPAATRKWVEQYVSSHGVTDMPTYSRTCHLTDADGNSGTLTFSFGPATNTALRVISSDFTLVPKGLIYAEGTPALGVRQFHCATNPACPMATMSRAAVSLYIPPAVAWWQTNVVDGVTNVAYVGSVTNTIYGSVVRFSTAQGDLYCYPADDGYGFSGAITVDGTNRYVRVARIKVFDRVRNALLPPRFSVMRTSPWRSLLSCYAGDVFELRHETEYYKAEEFDDFTRYSYHGHYYITEEDDLVWGVQSVTWENARGEKTTFGSIAEMIKVELFAGHVKDLESPQKVTTLLENYESPLIYSDNGETRITVSALAASAEYADIVEKAQKIIDNIDNAFASIKRLGCPLPGDFDRTEDVPKEDEQPEPEPESGEVEPNPPPRTDPPRPPLASCQHDIAVGKCGDWRCARCKCRLEDGPAVHAYGRETGHCAICQNTFRGAKCRVESRNPDDHYDWKKMNETICHCMHGEGYFERKHEPYRADVPWTQAHDAERGYYHEHEYQCIWCRGFYRRDQEPHNMDEYDGAREVHDASGASKCEYKWLCSKCDFPSYTTNAHIFAAAECRRLCESIAGNDRTHRQTVWCAKCDEANEVAEVAHAWGAPQFAKPVYFDETHHNYGSRVCNVGTVGVDCCGYVTNLTLEAHTMSVRPADLVYGDNGDGTHNISNLCVTCGGYVKIGVAQHGDWIDDNPGQNVMDGTHHCAKCGAKVAHSYGDEWESFCVGRGKTCTATGCGHVFFTTEANANE